MFDIRDMNDCAKRRQHLHLLQDVLATCRSNNEQLPTLGKHAQVTTNFFALADMKIWCQKKMSEHVNPL